MYLLDELTSIGTNLLQNRLDLIEKDTSIEILVGRHGRLIGSLEYKQPPKSWKNRVWKNRFWKKSVLEKPILEKIGFGKTDFGKTCFLEVPFCPV